MGTDAHAMATTAHRTIAGARAIQAAHSSIGHHRASHNGSAIWCSHWQASVTILHITASFYRQAIGKGALQTVTRERIPESPSANRRKGILRIPIGQVGIRAIHAIPIGLPWNVTIANCHIERVYWSACHKGSLWLGAEP